jgi:hypothetical protein
LTYLHNMLSSQTQFAAAKADGVTPSGDDDWEPTSSKNAAAAPVAAPKVQVVKASEEIEAASSAAPQKSKGAPPAAPVKQKVAGTPTLITPVNATPAQVPGVAPSASASPGGAAGLLRADTN